MGKDAGGTLTSLIVSQAEYLACFSVTLKNSANKFILHRTL